jgi:hypothetical protein
MWPAAVGWLVAGALLLSTAWLALAVWELRRQARAQRIAREEAQAWADEYQRERDALAAECEHLQSQLGNLRELYTGEVRRALARSFWLIAANAEWKKRL